MSLRNSWGGEASAAIQRAPAGWTCYFAYFAPPGALLRRIGRLSGYRGRARIITAERSDNNATIAAAAAQLTARRSAATVQMYEYQPATVHEKLAIVDDAVHIGSANFDFRSLSLPQPRDHAAHQGCRLRRGDASIISNASWQTAKWISPPRSTAAGRTSGAASNGPFRIFSGDDDGLHRHAPPELPQRSNASWWRRSDRPRTRSRAAR